MITLLDIKDSLQKTGRFWRVFTGDSITSCEWVHPNQLGNAYIAKVILQDVFGIAFDAEVYISTTLKGAKYPKY